MKMKKIGLATATALAVGLGGVFAASADSSVPQSWTVIGLSASNVNAGVTVKNTSDQELRCSLELADKKYIDPMFNPWNDPTLTHEEAEARSDKAKEDFARANSKSELKSQSSLEYYFGAGETRTFQWFGPSNASFNDAVILECMPQNGGFERIIVGYGLVQRDLSLTSTLPKPDETTSPTPNPTPKETVTVPTTVWKTTTAQVPTTVPTTVRETVTTTVTTKDQEPSLLPTTVTVTTPVTTTVRETETQTVPTTVRETETQTVPTTVTKTVTPTTAVQSQDSGELIGWIIGLIAALGLGGVAGFMANNLNLLPH